MKSMNEFLLTFVERFFVLHPKDKKKSESFDHAVAKFDLDEKSLQAKSLGLKGLSYSLAGMAIFFIFIQLIPIVLRQPKRCFNCVSGSRHGSGLGFPLPFLAFSNRAAQIRM